CAPARAPASSCAPRPEYIAGAPAAAALTLDSLSAGANGSRRMAEIRAQPERQAEEHDAEDDRVDAQRADQRAEAGPRMSNEKDPQDHRERAVQDQQPLSPDGPPQADGGGDAEETGDNGPGTDDVEEDKRHDGWHRKGDDRDEDVRQPLQ